MLPNTTAATGLKLVPTETVGNQRLRNNPIPLFFEVRMRSTQASAAIERLKARTGNTQYSLSCRSDGLFSLRLESAADSPTMLGDPLPMDEFVRFVDSIAPQQPKRISKLEISFREQLHKK